MKTILACNLRLDLPECRTSEQFHMPYGIGTIIEIMQAAEVKFDCFDTYAQGDTEDFLKYYKKQKHDVLLFSGILGNSALKYFDHVFKKIKEINPDAVIVLGGPITSVYPELLLKHIPVDILVLGEGEETIKELILCDFKPNESIKGIGFNNNIITPKREPLKTPLENKSKMHSFSHPGLEKLLKDYLKTQRELNRGWDLAATRGCLGDCIFCKKVFDKPIRYFSPEFVVGMMESIHQKHGIDRFSFYDENFVSIKPFIKKFIGLLENKKLDFKWRINARIDNFPIEYLDRMIKIGLYGVTLGLESASQKILDYYNKRIILDKYKSVARELSERDLLFASFIIGAEIESRETIKENIEFIRDIKLKRKNISVSYLTIIPGTKLFEKLFEKGIIKDKFSYMYNFNGDFFELDLNLSKMSNAELFAAKEEMLVAGTE